MSFRDAEHQITEKPYHIWKIMVDTRKETVNYIYTEINTPVRHVAMSSEDL